MTKRQGIYLTKHISDKELLSKIYKEPLKPNNKEVNKPGKMGGRSNKTHRIRYTHGN